MNGLLTIPEAAERLRCHPETVRRAVRSGAIHADKFGGKYLIDPDNLPLTLPPRPSPPKPARRRPTGHFAKLADEMEAA